MTNAMSGEWGSPIRSRAFNENSISQILPVRCGTWISAAVSLMALTISLRGWLKILQEVLSSL